MAGEGELYRAALHEIVAAHPHVRATKYPARFTMGHRSGRMPLSADIIVSYDERARVGLKWEVGGYWRRCHWHVGTCDLHLRLHAQLDAWYLALRSWHRKRQRIQQRNAAWARRLARTQTKYVSDAEVTTLNLNDDGYTRQADSDWHLATTYCHYRLP
jgi:hypothetical protein